MALSKYLPIKKHGSLLVMLAILAMPCLAQNVGINTDGSLPNANAMLDIKSNDKGILIPRMDSNARKSIPNTIGLLVYDSTYHSFWYNNGTSWVNISTGSGWSLTGNSGIGSSQFLGTVDPQPLLIKVNNQQSGFITSDNAVANTFWGFAAGSSNTTGTGNSAVGYSALSSSSTGNNNVAMGYKTLLANTTGSFNIATGYQTLLFNTTGSVNIATGDNTMQSNTSGRNNVAYGGASLYANTTGRNNTAIGDFALQGNRAGDFNTALGSDADVVSQSDLTNATAIGAHAIVDASNKVRIGDVNVTVIEGQVPFTTPSDGRFKYNIEENVKGLDFILKLRPVTYQFNVQRFDASLRSGEISNTSIQSIRAKRSGLSIPDDQSADDSANKSVQSSYNEASQIRRTGFIAQEVEKAAIESGYNFSGIIKPKTDKEHYSLSYESFVVPLVKAIQELNTKVEILEKQVEQSGIPMIIGKQQQIIDTQNKKIADLQKQVTELLQYVQSQKANK